LRRRGAINATVVVLATLKETFMADKQLVLAIFKDEAAAETAVGMLRGGIDDYTEIDLGPIGILVLDDEGKIKEHKMGQRSGGKGAAIGLAVAAVTPVGLAAIVGGAALGHFRQQGPGFSAEEQARLTAELSGGQAALGVIVAPEKAALMKEILTDLGGQAEAHAVSDEAIEAAAAAAPEAAESS
jgi:hypothetical protein